MALKTCTKCGKEKDTREFFENTWSGFKDNLLTWCKVCHSEYNQEYYRRNSAEILERQKRRLESTNYQQIRYAKNKGKLLAQNKRKRREYITEWRGYFKSIYGEEPQCQICGKPLIWEGHKGDVVHFDHRNNNSLIQDAPKSWYSSRPVNEKNITIWLSCDFGILCRRCNFMLFTDGRKEWLEVALKYTNGV